MPTHLASSVPSEWSWPRICHGERLVCNQPSQNVECRTPNLECRSERHGVFCPSRRLSPAAQSEGMGDALGNLGKRPRRQSSFCHQSFCHPLLPGPLCCSSIRLLSLPKGMGGSPESPALTLAGRIPPGYPWPRASLLGFRFTGLVLSSLLRLRRPTSLGFAYAHS